MTNFCSDRLQGFQHGSGRTDEDLAAQLGVATATVRAWGDPHSQAAPANVVAVAAALEIDVEDLAPTGQGPWWDYVSAVALCAGPRPEDVLSTLARLLSGSPAPAAPAAARQDGTTRHVAA